MLLTLAKKFTSIIIVKTYYDQAWLTPFAFNRKVNWVRNRLRKFDQKKKKIGEGELWEKPLTYLCLQLYYITFLGEQQLWQPPLLIFDERVHMKWHICYAFPEIYSESRKKHLLDHCPYALSIILQASFLG